jgi:hypothetical protein
MGPSNLRDPPLYYDRSIFYTSLTRELTKETFARMGVSTFFIILLLTPKCICDAPILSSSEQLQWKAKGTTRAASLEWATTMV